MINIFRNYKVLNKSNVFVWVKRGVAVKEEGGRRVQCALEEKCFNAVEGRVSDGVKVQLTTILITSTSTGWVYSNVSF